MASDVKSKQNREGRDVLNSDKYESVLESIDKFSSSLSERAIINKLVEPLRSQLPFDKEVIRTVLLYSFKQYRKKHTVPIQKLALLERGKRDQNLLDLKDSIIESFVSVIGDKKQMRKLIKSVEKGLNSFFDPYLEF